MASIVKRGNSYSVVYYHKDTEGGILKQKWETYYSMENALTRKEELENPVKFLDRVSQIITFKDLLNEYINLHGKLNWSFSMYTNYTSLIRRYLEPFIGDIKLHQINPLLMSRFYEKLNRMPPSKNKYKPNQNKTITKSTIFEIHQLLRSVFNQAVIWGYISENPIRHIRIKKPNNPIPILNAEQVLSLVNEATLSGEVFLSLAIQMAFIASLRKGELAALKWEDVDFDNCSIRVDKELSRVPTDTLDAIGDRDVYQIFLPLTSNSKSRLIIKTPKTSSSVRTIYLPQSLIDNLSQWRNLQNLQKEAQGNKYKEFNLIFAKENGLPLQEKDLNNNFHKLLKECDLPKVTFHSLRHTSTTYKLIISNGNIKAVQGDTGHSQPTMVLNTYSRILDEERKRLANKLELTFCSRLQIRDEVKDMN